MMELGESVVPSLNSCCDAATENDAAVKVIVAVLLVAAPESSTSDAPLTSACESTLLDGAAPTRLFQTLPADPAAAAPVTAGAPLCELSRKATLMAVSAGV